MSVKNAGIRFAVAWFVAAATVGGGAAKAQSQVPPWPAEASPGLAALAEASQQDKYAFVLFWKQQDDATDRMFGQLNDVIAHETAKPAIVSISVGDPAEAESVKVFGVDRAPMPLLVAVAPNGAITKAWPMRFDGRELPAAMVSRGAAQTLKALQDNKMVVLCVQHATAETETAVLRAAREFQASEGYATTTQVVVVHQNDPAENAFLTSIQLDPNNPEPVTVLIAPPGRPFAKLVGNVTAEQIAAKVIAAGSACCPDGQCGPGAQCCPGGQCPPQK